MDWGKLRWLRDLTRLHGRMPMEEFKSAQTRLFGAFLLLSVAMCVLAVVFQALAWFLLAGLTIIFGSVASLPAEVRRAHDVGISGWWMAPSRLGLPLLFVTWLMGLVGDWVAAGIFLAIAAVTVVPTIRISMMRGTPGPNRYGPEPTTAQPEPFNPTTPEVSRKVWIEQELARARQEVDAAKARLENRPS